MTRYRDPPSRADRATAIAAVALVHFGLAALILGGSRVGPKMADQPATQMIDVALPAPPPPPPPRTEPAKAERGSAGKEATASPIVAPVPRIELPAISPLAAAPVAASGSASAAGAASAGSGSGAGGTGTGAGGGNGKRAGNGIGEDARLLSGGLNRRDYRRLRGFAPPSGRAVLAILIGPDGRVARCAARQSSGNPALDAALCSILQPRMIWAPARDRGGTPLTVGIDYTAVWSRD